MEVSMSITRRGKYTNSNICINVQVRNVVCLFFLLYANLLVLVTLCEGNHYPFIEERYEKGLCFHIWCPLINRLPREQISGSGTEGN